MMRVMIVTNSLTGGGAERSMNLIANELWGRGISVSLVPVNDGPPDEVMPACEILPLQRIWPGGLIHTLNSFRKFNKLVRFWRPSHIILNCDLPELFGALLLQKVPLIVVEHSSFPWNTRKKVGILVRFLLKKKAATWIAVSSHLTIWPNHEKPEFVIQNPIQSIQDDLIIVPSQKIQRLIFIGRLSKEKQPDWLLEITRKTSIKTEIIGDGLLRSELENVATRNHLQVNFHGQQLKPWAHLGPGDLLIIPSSYEGDGLVFVEAMLYKCPVLLSDIPDLRRFQLPDQHYCRTVEDFVASINLFKENLTELVVPPDYCSSILELRSLDKIGDLWEIALNTRSI